MKLPLRFEMTITPAEFRRLLPAAVDHVAYAEEGAAFVHRDGARGWRIRTERLPQLRLGLIRLERQRVDFEFDGYSPKEVQEFMTRFEMYFRRGGG